MVKLIIMIFRGCLVIGFLIAAFVLYFIGVEMLPTWLLVVVWLLLLVVAIVFGGESDEVGIVSLMLWGVIVFAVVMTYLVQSVVDLDQMGATSFEAVSKQEANNP